MFKPISVIEDTEDQTVYKYSTIYLWIMYGILGIIVIGFLSKLNLITVSGCILMIIYFFTVSTKYRQHGKEMKEATKEGSIQVSGNKWSFKNPLKIIIPKQKHTDPGTRG